MPDPRIESLNDDMTLEEILEVEKSGKCPKCDDDVDTGAGFGRRDLECGNCGWYASYPIELWRS